MTVKIYADVLFLLCSLTVFTAYGGVCLMLNRSISLKRLISGSFVISLLSVIIVLYFKQWINPVSVFLLTVLGTYLCLDIKALKLNIFCSLAALACGTLIGGVRLALFNLGIFDNGVWGMILTLALLYLGFFAVLKRIRAVTVKKQQLYAVTVYKGNKRVDLIALADTGNELRGQDSERVIIAERQAVSCLYEGAEVALRLLPYKTVGKGEGVLIGVVCDYILLNGKRYNKVIVAAVDARLGAYYNALINPETEVI